MTDSSGNVPPAGQPWALEMRNLGVTFEAGGQPIQLLEDVSLQISRGEILGLVGESGSGKTMTALALLRLLPAGARAHGEIWLDGTELLALPERAMRRVRGGKIGFVFQEPMAALNPAFTIGNQLKAAIRAHSDMSDRQATARAIELLQMVRVPSPAQRLNFYPHQLSGGLCQRVMIAMAMAGGAQFIVADEPTTSLDVTIQDQIVKLLEQLVAETRISVLFISHDLGLVARLCNRIAVAYAGQIVETGDTRSLLDTPRHPYTQMLVRCVPDIEDLGEMLGGIPGTPPLASDWPEGCRFRARCPAAIAGCEKPQALKSVGSGQQVRCWRAMDDAMRPRIARTA